MVLYIYICVYLHTYIQLQWFFSQYSDEIGWEISQRNESHRTGEAFVQSHTINCWLGSEPRVPFSQDQAFPALHGARINTSKPPVCIHKWDSGNELKVFYDQKWQGKATVNSPSSCCENECLLFEKVCLVFLHLLRGGHVISCQSSSSLLSWASSKSLVWFLQRWEPQLELNLCDKGLTWLNQGPQLCMFFAARVHIGSSLFPQHPAPCSLCLLWAPWRAVVSLRFKVHRSCHTGVGWRIEPRATTPEGGAAGRQDGNGSEEAEPKEWPGKQRGPGRGHVWEAVRARMSMIQARDTAERRPPQLASLLLHSLNVLVQKRVNGKAWLGCLRAVREINPEKKRVVEILS